MIHRFFVLFLYLTFVLKSNGVGMSASTNGLYLVIAGERSELWDSRNTNGIVKFDDTLAWSAFYDGGKIGLIYPKNYAYGLKIKMTGVDGKELPKTALGKTCGTKWESLSGIYDSNGNLRDVHPSRFDAWGSYKENSGMGGGILLPSAQELFKIEKPGVYTMEIQMQMFYTNPSSTNKWHKDVFQFSPIKIKIEKP